MIKSIFDTVPAAINDIGTKFWLDESTCDYCHKQLGNNYWVYYIETKDNYRTRVLIEGNTKIIYENQNLEAFCSRIDIMKLANNK